MSQETKEKESSVSVFGQIPLTDKFIIAAFPVMVYALVYTYKRGYYKVFELPAQLMTFSVVEVFNVVVGLLGVSFALLGLVNMVFSFLPKNLPYVIEWRLRRLFPFLVVFLALSYLYGSLWKEWLLLLVLGLVLGLIMFVPPLLTKRYHGSYLEKMKALDQEKVQSEDIFEDTRSLVYWAAGSLRGYQLATIVYGLIGLYVVYHAGRASALKQQVFRVASTSPETVVLVVNSDWMIGAPFDRKSKEVEPSFIMLEVPGEGNVGFRLEKIGPLHLREVAISQTVVPTPTLADTPTLTSTATLTLTPSVAPTTTPTTTVSSILSPTPP